MTPIRMFSKSNSPILNELEDGSMFDGKVNKKG